RRQDLAFGPEREHPAFHFEQVVDLKADDQVAVGALVQLLRGMPGLLADVAGSRRGKTQNHRLRARRAPQLAEAHVEIFGDAKFRWPIEANICFTHAANPARSEHPHLFAQMAVTDKEPVTVDAG